MNRPGHGRRGMILPIVFIVMVGLALFAFQYNRWVSQSQAVSFRLEQAEAGHRVAAAAMAETFSILLTETRSATSTLGAWLIGRTPPDEFDVPLPLTGSVLSTANPPLFHSSVTPSVRASVRRIDWRRQAADQRTNFFDREGIGTVGLSVRVELTRWGRTVASCSLEQHHDYKVVALVPPATGRGTVYIQGFPLDYALFVRNGRREFTDTGGNLLRDPRYQLDVRPDPGPPPVYGSVFFNGVAVTEYARFLPTGTVPLPQFFDRQGRPVDADSLRCRPWWHEDLWHRTIQYNSHLPTTGILEGGRLNLRGIVKVSGSVNIEQPTVYSGIGVLIADEIRVRARLTPAGDDDRCVLYAQAGNITIGTSEPVQAMLVAWSDQNNDDRIGRVHVLPGQKLTLTGGLVADWLDLHRWPANASHTITFDRRWVSPAAIYQITVSNWITFSRSSGTGA